MRLSFIILFLSALSLTIFAQVDIVGHRGASYLAPENTIASAKLGWAVEADGVEIDIYLTADDRVVLSHDKNTNRTAGVNYLIPETESAVLRTLDVGSWKDPKYVGEKIPFLEEILEIIPDDKSKYLVIEIKTGPEIFPALQKLIKQSNKLDQIVFISFDWESIKMAKELFPTNKSFWLTANKNELLSKIEACAELGLDGINVHYNLVDVELMKQAHSLGLDVWVWTVNKPKEAKRAAKLGVKAITTDRPGWLREQITK